MPSTASDPAKNCLGGDSIAASCTSALPSFARISRLLVVVRLPLRFDRGRGGVALDGKIAEHDGLRCEEVGSDEAGLNDCHLDPERYR